MNLFEYFTTDNISGKKCTEKWLSLNNPELYKEIIDWCNQIDILKNIEFKRKVYHFIKKLYEIPVCKTCNGLVAYSRIRDGYRAHCSDKCVKNSEIYLEKWKKTWNKNNEDGKFIEKRKQTALSKYGSIKNYKKIIRDSYEKSMVEKYGVTTIFEIPEFKSKRKQTLKEKYGSETYNNSDKTRKTRIENGTQISDDSFDGFENYKKIVTNRTSTIYRNNKEKINPNNLERSPKTYHLDHLYSIKQGFLNNLPIEIITHPCNLHMINYQENLIKQDNCWITRDELLKNIICYESEINLNHSYLKEIYSNIKDVAKKLLENNNIYPI
jgi:hypothetical protein